MVVNYLCQVWWEVCSQVQFLSQRLFHVGDGGGKMIEGVDRGVSTLEKTMEGKQPMPNMTTVILSSSMAGGRSAPSLPGI